MVPNVNITEMWAFPMRDRNKLDNWDAIEGNRLAMQWVRNAYITLYQEPYKIVYFPLRHIPPAYELKLWALPPDLVLYNHQVRFKRKNWKKLERCMKYMKPKPLVLELAVQLQDSLTQNLEKMIYNGSGVEYVGTAEFGRAEYAFTTKEYIDQWKIKMDFYPCILA